MAINVKNLETGNVVRISGIRFVNGIIVPKKNNLGQRFIEAHADALTAHEEDGKQTFSVNAGWEMIVGRVAKENESESAPAKRTSAKREKKTESAPAQPAPAENVTEEAKVENAPAPAPAQPAPAQESESGSDAELLYSLITRAKGENVNETKVRAIFAEEISKYFAAEPKKAQIVRAKVQKENKEEVFCEDFERIVSKVSRGHNVYLYGRAGSGKSHTAKQIAEALGLEFYGQTTIQFSHEVAGYGDAAGNYVPTLFFKAFSEGGLYFQDEYDRSSPEAAITLNSALANGWFNFPIVGKVEMHPNFRFIAAGNTTLNGADEEYITGQQLDASSRDRFAFFFRVDYDRRVEMQIANEHAEIVDFNEDVRKAIVTLGIKHVVSYRATIAMLDETLYDKDFVKCCKQSVFKGLEVDAIREIYGALTDKENVWAKATRKLF